MFFGGNRSALPGFAPNGARFSGETLGAIYISLLRSETSSTVDVISSIHQLQIFFSMAKVGN